MFYFFTKYVQSRLLQNCRMREWVKEYGDIVVIVIWGRKKRMKKIVVDHNSFNFSVFKQITYRDDTQNKQCEKKCNTDSISNYCDLMPNSCGLKHF